MKDFGKSHVLPSFFPLRKKAKSWRTSHHQMLLTMKLTIVLMTVALLHVHAGVFSQNVTISGRNLSLKKVFSVIESQTGYAFFYRNELLKNAKPVTLDVKNAPLESVLQLCFADQPFGYDIQNKTVFVTAPSAQQRVSINLKGATLDKVFAEIEKRSGYTVFYNTEVLKSSGLVTVEMKDATIEDVMRQCLKGLPLEYSIQDKTIFVKHDSKKTTFETLSPAGGSGPPAVSGLVRSESGTPLAGATIFIKKIKKTGITDAAGEFLMKGIPDGDYEIEISFVGFEPYKTTVKVVDHQAKITAALKQSMNKLDESVVIAYGTTTQRLNTGDISTVTSKEIEEQPVTNPLAALEGRVPGLVVNQTTGMPGGNFTVEIRGQNSLVNGNDPFFVIDGVPYNSEIPGTNQGYGTINTSLRGGSPLNYLNPYDIESIEVLKDADATAIYGSRAANGAILITTKKGKAGTTKIDLNSYSGTSKVSHTVDLLSTNQYLSMRHEAFQNDGTTPSPTADFDLTFWDTTRYTNWQKAFFGNTGHLYSGQASVSGGNANTQFLIGGGFTRETTPFPVILPSDGVDQKASVHININSRSQDNRFKILFTGSYVSDYSTVQSNEPTNLALELSPDAPMLYNADHSWNWAPMVNGQQGTWKNPLASLLKGYSNLTSNVISDALLSYEIIRNLDVKASLGYTNTQTNETQTIPTTYFDPGLNTASGSSAFNSINTHSWIVEPQATYKLRVGKGAFSVLAGTSFHESESSAQILDAAGFSSDALLKNIQGASNVTVRYSNNTQYKYNAVFGRIGYSWDDKYLINLNGRRDGSSRFGPGRQFANFGSVGAGWIFSKENFIQEKMRFISFGKVRGSYGTTGNDAISDYQFLDTYAPTQYPYQGIQGLYPTSLFNPDLAWEVNKKLEGGIELGLLKDRISIVANFYRNRSSNQLVNSLVPYVTGFVSVPENLPALVQNTGQEFIINTTNIKNKHFTWSSSFNLSINRNKLLAFPNIENSNYSQTFTVGKSLNAHKVIHSLGVNDSTGLYQFTDFKGTPTYTPDVTTDRTTLINTDPKFYGGFVNTFSFKGFRLSSLFQFVKQDATSFIGAYAQMPGKMVNQPNTILERWQNPGDVKPYQKFSQNQSFFSNTYRSFSNAVFYSDFAYTDASFIRLKNVSFSWEAPTSLTRKVHFQSARIYLQGQNLLTITNYKGLDPESHNVSLPPMRVYTLGIQLGL